MRRLVTIALGLALALGGVACGDVYEDDDDGGTAASTRTAGPPVTTPDTPDSATPGGNGGGIGSATPPVPAGTQLVAAPIEEADIIIRESFPPQYAMRIVSGLPNGCHQFHSATLTRTGDDITIAVMNTLPTDPNIACTQVYGTHESAVDMGSDFVSGQEYVVRVNELMVRFTAQ